MLLSSCHPVANLCLPPAPPAQTPLKPGAVGTHRYTHTPPPTHAVALTLPGTLLDTDARGGTQAYTSSETHASIHVHTPLTHTHTHTHARAMPHSARRQRMEPRQEARCPHAGRHPTLQSRKTTCKQPRECFQPRSLSTPWGPRSRRGFFLEGSSFGALCDRGAAHLGPAHALADLTRTCPASRSGQQRDSGQRLLGAGLWEEGAGCTGRAEGAPRNYSRKVQHCWPEG